jgi:predicted ABC-type ATPase
MTLAAHLARWRKAGYRIHVVFLWLPSAELALRRVRARVQAGGHSVPDETVRRRFERGRLRFFSAYIPLADHWRLYDASVLTGPRLIATGRRAAHRRILKRELWRHAAGETP